MDVTATQFKLLNEAFLSALPKAEALQLFVRIRLKDSPTTIEGESMDAGAVLKLIEWVEAQERMAKQEATIQTYLNSFLQEIEGRLSEMLSLSALEIPEAVEGSRGTLRYITLPPTMPSNVARSSHSLSTRIFDNFSDTVAALGTRILLLGAPGSGKTTTLLQFACTAARARQQSPNKPLPIFISAHRWDPKISLAEWTQNILHSSLPDVRTEGRSLLYLFDGLDELGGERPVDPEQLQGEKYDPRIALLKAIAEQLPDASVCLSCREQDYQQIGEKAKLQGAVTLLPLQIAQVESFLSHRNQSALWSAMAADPNLMELARTPLLLALLSMATGNASANEALDISDITPSSIFDFYIGSRFLHEASKRTLPFDEQKTRAHLNKIAVAMMSPWNSPKELHLSEVSRLIGAPSEEFIEFVQSMHFMRMDAMQFVQFIHPQLRDYFAGEDPAKNAKIEYKMLVDKKFQTSLTREETDRLEDLRAEIDAIESQRSRPDNWDIQHQKLREELEQILAEAESLPKS